MKRPTNWDKNQPYYSSHQCAHILEISPTEEKKIGPICLILICNGHIFALLRLQAK